MEDHVYNGLHDLFDVSKYNVGIDVFNDNLDEKCMNVDYFTVAI